MVQPVPYDGAQYRWLCYSDIYVLHFVRNFDEAPVPYVNGSGVLDDQRTAAGEPTEVGDLEYPVGTGLVVAAAALLTDDPVIFFAVTALLLAVAALWTTASLASMVADRRRILLYALSPSLVLYAFHNWDLVAVAFAVAGLAAFRARRDALSGALLGLGAAAKLYPGLLVVPLFLATIRRERRRALRLLFASAATVVAVNLPFALANPAGWWFPFEFQSSRFPNYETSWFFLHQRWFSEWSAEAYGAFTARASLLLFLLGAAVLVALELRRASVRPYALAFQIVLLFLLTAKVFSPQFALWVIPFFALIRLPAAAFVAFSISEASVWVATAAFLRALQYGQGSRATWLAVVEVAVWVRYAVLALLLVLARRAEENVTPATAAPTPA